MASIFDVQVQQGVGFDNFYVVQLDGRHDGSNDSGRCDREQSWFCHWPSGCCLFFFPVHVVLS